MRSYRTILVPTDFGDASTAALDLAVELARPFHAEIVVLHVYSIPVVGSGEGPLVMAELTERIFEAAESCLADAVSVHRSCGVPMRTLLREGDPSSVIQEVTNAVDADLVSMGTHGRRGLPRFLIGSVAEKVIRASRVPVLTVHPRGRYHDVHTSRSSTHAAAAAG